VTADSALIRSLLAKTHASTTKEFLMPKPKGNSSAFSRMTRGEADGYHQYHVNRRSGRPQNEDTRAGNTAYARAMRLERAAKQREEKVRGQSS